jgi:hypothetical protein
MNNKELEKLEEGAEVVLKLKDIVNSLEALNILTAEKLPVFTSFKLSLFLKNVSPAIEVYQKTRDELINELGAKVLDKDGKETEQFKFEPEKAKEFNEKISAVLEEVIDVKVPLIKISDLDGVKLEPNNIAKLLWLIKE